MALGTLLEASGAEKNSLEGSWSRLGALEIASKRPEGDRWEVNGRLTEHLSLAMAPGERHYQRLPGKKQQPTPGNGGSEHALGQRPGEFNPHR